ncbi:hypothetical protein ACFLSJ_05425 [Verrucomicrobiota bacterium]
MFKWLQKLRVRERVAVAGAAAVLCLLLVQYLVARPIVRAYTRLDEAERVRSADLKYSLGAEGRRPGVVREYDALARFIQSTSTSADSIDEMKRQIEKLADETEVSLLSREPRKPVTADFYREYAIEIGKFEAGMTQLLAFLHGLPNLDGTLRVSELSLSPEKGRNQVKGSMVITKVLRPEERVAPTD